MVLVHKRLTSSSCVWAAVQTKSTRSSSNLVLLMSGDRRSSRQFGGRRMLQSKIIWSADCSSALQMYLGASSMPQWYRHAQARRQDVAAGGAKNQKGGHIFKIQYWMYEETGGPNVKWGGTDFKWGAGHHWPPAGDGPGHPQSDAGSQPI